MVSRTPDHTTDGPPCGLALAIVTGHIDPADVTRCTHIVEVPPETTLHRVQDTGGTLLEVEACHAGTVAKGERVGYRHHVWRVVKAGRWGAWLVRVEGARQ